MAASLSTIAGKDGNGSVITNGVQALDLSGAGAGPWSFANVIVDGTAGANRAAVKPASTAPVATDPALVVALSPNGLNPNGQAASANSAPVVGASDWVAQTGGDVASGAADSGKPVKIGGVAKISNPAAVTDGQRVNAMFDKVGRQATVPGQVRELIGDQTTSITATTAATTIVAADVNNMNDLTGLILTNTSPTGTEVHLLNDDGTTLRAAFWAPGNDTRGIVFARPFKQTAVNKAWKMITVTSISSLKVTAQFEKNI